MAILSQARIHINFHRFREIGQIFHNKYILNNKKNTFQVEIWPISYLNDAENPGKVDFKELKSKTFSGGSLLPDPPRSLCLQHSFRKLVSIYPRSAPVSCGGVLYWYSSTGILLLKTGQSYHLPFLF